MVPTQPSTSSNPPAPLSAPSVVNPNRPPPRTTPLVVRSTPPIRQSFPLPSTRFFTGSLFDSMVIFLQKYSIEWHDIQCVARGVHPDVAVPTICILVTSPADMDEVVSLWKDHCSENSRAGGKVGGGGGMGNLEDMIPDEVVEVEFARVYGDLLVGGAAATNRSAERNGAGALVGFLGSGGSIASLVASSLKNAAAARSEVSLACCTCAPASLAKRGEEPAQADEWSAFGDDGDSLEESEAVEDEIPCGDSCWQ